MYTRHQLLSKPEYWFEEAQNELYRQVIEYKEKKGITQTELADELGVSKGYVSQILKGEFNFTLKKLIEISLAIGMVPRLEFIPLADVKKNDQPANRPLTAVAEHESKYKKRSRD
jgi:transcriptional regulator with XRE-family HTH domain